MPVLVFVDEGIIDVYARSVQDEVVFLDLVECIGMTEDRGIVLPVGAFSARDRNLCIGDLPALFEGLFSSRRFVRKSVIEDAEEAKLVGDVVAAEFRVETQFSARSGLGHVTRITLGGQGLFAAWKNRRTVGHTRCKLPVALLELWFFRKNGAVFTPEGLRLGTRPDQEDQATTEQEFDFPLLHCPKFLEYSQVPSPNP